METDCCILTYMYMYLCMTAYDVCLFVCLCLSVIRLLVVHIHYSMFGGEASIIE